MEFRRQQVEKALAGEFGLPLDIEKVHEEVRFVFDHPQRIAEEALAAAFLLDASEQRVPYRLLAGFYRSTGLNAGTLDLDGGSSLVAISTGLPLALFHAFSVVTERMDVSTLLPELDDRGRLVIAPRRKRLTRPRRGGGDSAALLNEEAVLRGSLRRLARMNRLQVAMMLYDLAMRFVVMHECMHIVLGHTGYARRRLGATSLMEMGASRRHLLPADVSQAFEFIADRHAVRGVGLWARTGRLGDYVEALPRLPSLSLETYLQRALILALVTLLRLFPSRLTAHDCAQDSHPHPYTRMRWMSREMGEDLASRTEHLQAVLEPLAYWTASFERNFLAPGRWTRAIHEDQNVDLDEAPLADRAYDAVTATTSRLQRTIWQAYSPLYPGDGRSGPGDLAP